MRHDSDVVLIGTGVAPLVAAVRLMAEGRSVLLLNPDSDFFLEDSEFALDRLQLLNSDQTPGVERFRRSTLDETLALLRPDFPGAIEKWIADGGAAPQSGAGQYHDPNAPHVRTRARLWVARKEDERSNLRFAQISRLAEQAGMSPRALDGILAVSRFPGHSLSSFAPSRLPGAALFPVEEWHGVVLPRVTDIDVNRYRNGLLGFVRERLGHERIFTRVSDMDLLPGGMVRFHAGGHVRTARYSAGTVVFWTPQLNRWVRGFSKRRNWSPPVPAGLRFWEQWSILSREPVDPTVVGMFEDMLVWADVEGVPSLASRSGDDIKGGASLRNEAIRMDEDRGAAKSVRTRLTVLRPAAVAPLGEDGALPAGSSGAGWISSSSFDQLERLCRGFLGWTRYSVRGLKARTTLEWPARPPLLRIPDMPGAWLASGVDGPLPKVVETARKCCAHILEEEVAGDGGGA